MQYRLTRQAERAVLAEAMCKNVGREEVHDMVDAIYDAFMHPDRGDYDET